MAISTRIGNLYFEYTNLQNIQVLSDHDKICLSKQDVLQLEEFISSWIGKSKRLSTNLEKALRWFNIFPSITVLSNVVRGCCEGVEYDLPMDFSVLEDLSKLKLTKTTDNINSKLFYELTEDGVMYLNALPS